MEKKSSVSSHMKNINISYVSPVKQFDLPLQDESNPVKKRRKCTIKSTDKVTDLEVTVNRQQDEIKKLKELILVKDDKLRLDKVKLDTATKLLDQCAKGCTDMTEVNIFLNKVPKKRKVSEDSEEVASKKKKVLEMDDKKLFSFDKDKVNQNILKRKRKPEDDEVDDLTVLLKKPSPLEAEKERELDKLDKKIKEDQDNFNKLQDQWKVDDMKKQKFQELNLVEKKRAAAIKDRVRNEISKEDLIKKTEENIEFLYKIISGNIQTPKHSKFFDKCGLRAQSLFYETLNNPFSEEQVDTVHELVHKEFRSVPKIDENYISWVLVSET